MKGYSVDNWLATFKCDLLDKKVKKNPKYISNQLI